MLTSLKNVQDIDANILSAQKSTDNVYRSLLLMLGWSADSQPEIRDIPEPDLARIGAMNPDADREQAIANNYGIKSDEHKLKNLKTNEQADATKADLEDKLNQVYSSLKTQYNAVLDAKDALDAANIKLQLETVNMNAASAGEMTQGNWTWIPLRTGLACLCARTRRALSMQGPTCSVPVRLPGSGCP